MTSICQKAVIQYGCKKEKRGMKTIKSLLKVFIKSKGVKIVMRSDYTDKKEYMVLARKRTFDFNERESYYQKKFLTNCLR